FLLRELFDMHSETIGASSFQPSIERPQHDQSREQKRNERDPKSPPASFGGAVEMASAFALFIHSRRDIQTRISKSPPNTVLHAPREDRKEKIRIDWTTKNRACCDAFQGYEEIIFIGTRRGGASRTSSSGRHYSIHQHRD